MLGFLYGQTEYNLLKNSLRIKDYVNYASEYGYKALSITDSNMYGHYKFYKECINKDIKPLIGLEIKLEDVTLLAYALNNDGYKNLLHISSYIMINENANLELLEKYKANIYFVIVMLDDPNKILDKYYFFKDRLKNVGVGISENDTLLYNLLEKKKISMYPLAKTLYLNSEDYKVYKALIEIGGSSEDKTGGKLKTNKELEGFYNSFPKAFEYLEKLVNYVNVDLGKRNILLPKYKTPNNKSSKDYLSELCHKGLNKRIGLSKIDTKPYFDRLNYELSIINKMGYDDYFLIVWDFIKYAKQHKVLVGPGRGSGAGSLVAYSIGINNINPLKYDLLFERFLNPQRVTMPDIDTDFPDDKRNMVIDYVKDLYKDTHVCSISAYNTFQIKSAIRDLGRIRKIDPSRLNEIVNMASKAIDEARYDELVNNSFGEVKEILYIAQKLKDLPRHISTHTAGIILANENLFDLIPMQNGINGLYQSQLEASDLEELGLLKIDFLGLRNLTIIDNIISRIDKFNNLNIYDIEKNDKATYELLSSGDTKGIFQLDSEGITKVIKKLKPNNFMDLVALLALYRPGPMAYIDEYIDRKNGKEFSYIHDDLKPILAETYGIIIYQEQIMKICLKFAGYSLGEADILRRAVSKKKADILEAERERFVKSSMNLGYSDLVANRIYDDIVKFANYGFNKSHSVAYATLTYVMAYLKANYKLEFILAQLNNVIGNIEETTYYLNYARSNKIKIYGPSINVSSNKYEVIDDRLFMPLNAIKGVGDRLAMAISEERKKGKYLNLMNFKNRVSISDDVLKSIIYSGACDSFKISKKSLINMIDNVNIVIDSYLGSDKLDFDNGEYDFEYLRKAEFEAIGINIKYNMFRNIDMLINKYHSKNLADIKINGRARVIIKFEALKEIMTKKGDIMLVGTLFDGITIMDFVMFSDVYDAYRGDLVKTKLYLVYGAVEKPKNKDNLNFKINEIKSVE
ncbi:MAG: DNA polymerase III subunit alpha [Anaeroplasmataceae bacterium]